MADLTDKIVLVTGAAGAIGAAVVAAVRRAGGTAIATDLSGRKGIDEALDVTVEADWLRVAAEIGRKHDRLDGLVNAAGIAVLASIEKTDFATWRRVLSVNLDGASRLQARFRATQEERWLHRQLIFSVRPRRRP